MFDVGMMRRAIIMDETRPYIRLQLMVSGNQRMWISGISSFRGYVHEAVHEQNRNRPGESTVKTGGW